MASRKIILSLLFVVVEIITVSVFWSETFFLAIILMGLAILKHKILPIKRELLWFLVVGTLGADDCPKLTCPRVYLNLL